MNLFTKKNTAGNYARISVQDAQRFANTTIGTYYECDADILGCVRTGPDDYNRRATYREGQLKALRAPRNQSKLGLLGHSVLIAVGNKHWTDHCDIPQNADVWDENIPQQAWAQAMAKMKAFYLEVANRQGIQL